MHFLLSSGMRFGEAVLTTCAFLENKVKRLLFLMLLLLASKDYEISCAECYLFQESKEGEGCREDNNVDKC